MVGVIGLGFVGLTTALGIAYKGLDVFGFDVDKGKINSIKNRVPPFYEPHLQDILTHTLYTKFHICNSLREVIDNSEVIIYCVGTPNTNDGSSDLQYLLRAIDDSLPIIKRYFHKSYKVIVIKSTVPPTTTKYVVRNIIEQMGFKIGDNIGLANNPEFLREGYAWEDFINPDRIIIGVEDKNSCELLEKIYRPFNSPIYVISYNGAEFVKYLSNTLLATMISFSNEMSMIADYIGEIDIPLSFKVLHQDKRWFGAPAPMTSYVYPGCGFGGYCLPKDLEAIYHQALTFGYDASLLKSVSAINDKIKQFVVDKISSIVKKEDNIGILGLSFKPNSDDVRETPAKYIIKLLLDKGFRKIFAYDPLAIDNFKNKYNLPIQYIYDLDSIVNLVDTLVILTGWDEFKYGKPKFQGKTVIDFRYIL